MTGVFEALALSGAASQSTIEASYVLTVSMNAPNQLWAVEPMNREPSYATSKRSCLRFASGTRLFTLRISMPTT